jgi:hypothetical protein
MFLPDGSVDCAAYENYIGYEPAEVAAACPVDAPPVRVSRPLATTDMGYAQDLRNGRFVSFTLNNFTGQTLIASIANTIYGMDFDTDADVLWALNDTTDQLGTINLTTGVFSGVVPCPAPADIWTGLSIDPVSGAFFASTATNLYTINPGTGAATLIGAFGTSLMIDIAINASGQMYGHDIGTDSIYSINMSTGAASLIGLTGYNANFAQGMDFDNDDGTLYIFLYIGTGNNVFGTVNLSTGAVTPLASNSPTGEFEGAIKTAGPEMYKVYLPLILKPLVEPPTPVLNDINNGGNSGYTVSWSASLGATAYLLQEDDNDAFTSPSTAYDGANTSVPLSNGLGTYYYRVKAYNPEYSSGWSNVVSATVTNEGPTDGSWSGPIGGGYTITMTVISSGTMIDTINLYVNWAGACGLASSNLYFYDTPIASNGTFSKTSGSSSVAGTFTSTTAANGTYHAYANTGSCTVTRDGTWTATYSP